MNRREFLSASVGAACGLAAIPALAAESGSQPRVALIGCGPRGLALAHIVVQTGYRVIAACDADLAQAQVAAARHGATPYPNVRELLAAASPEIGIVTGRVEAADLSALLRAETHLFLDTIPTKSLPEGRELRKTAEASGMVIQVNLDGCGLLGCPKAAALLQSGDIGEVSIVRGHVHHYHPSTPCMDQGTLLKWAGEWLAWSGEGSPRQVTATGNERDQVITWEFDRLTAIWEQRVFASTAGERVSTGSTSYGSGGVLRVDENTWRFLRHSDAREERGTISVQDRDADCWSEFTRAIREQRRTRRSLEIALNAAEMVRLAECSLKLERPLEWDGRRRLVIGDAAANRLLRAAPEWLA